MALDNRSLLAFLQVARLGSIGAAATSISITQPALSRTLRNLEQKLGVSLFIRHSTGMELTSFGRALLPHAALIESGLYRAKEEIDLLKGASKGVARVGILPSLIPDSLPLVLNKLLKKLPGIELQILEAPNHKLILALLNGDIDFAVAAISPEFSDEKLVVSAIIEDENYIVASSRHSVVKKKRLKLTDLLSYQWALQEKGGAIWRDFRAMFAASQLEPPKITLTANSITTLKTAIISSDMLTVLPEVSIKAERDMGILQIVPVENVRWRRQIGIMRRSVGPILPVAVLALSEFRDALREIPRRL
ncbi:MAG TPA: LysR family transcriptional regulator [Steroidobacteraceae bacterium]|jgi:DNA-binding transcriptional LysR family regulator|nr:LysR family transcriptional regulator [Steroidobacteraceae bacterium]